MDFRILGPLEVSHDGHPVPLTGAGQRELLALLLLDAGRVVSTDRLLDEMWGPKQPTGGAAALRVRITRLRQALRVGGDVLVTRPPGYALLVPPQGLDLWRFERGVEEGERALSSDPQHAVDALTAALAEWRGPPLVDIAYAPFAQAAIVRLEELHASALELRIEADLVLGRHGRLVGELQSLVNEHPLRERLWAQLMTALYRDGRQADALAAYRSARERLVEEIGIEPGPELRTLEGRILAQDPELAAKQTPTAPATRAVLAVCTGSDLTPAHAAARLAAAATAEAVAVALVTMPDDVPAATAGLRAAAPTARVAAFTSDDRSGDTVRLTAEQDAAILLLSLPDTHEIDTETASVLRAAPCDVGLLRGNDTTPGTVLVPFAGHRHDWAAAELGALLGNGAVTLLGVRSRASAGRDASRLLASASLALQRGAGIRADTLLTGEGAKGVLEAAAGAAAIVVGLSERWQQEGLGKARRQLVRDATCPVVLVRRGVRPGALAPPEALTRFTWSAAS